MLPLLLRFLCKAFNIQIGKGYFPFYLNDIFYKGIFPSIKYWTNISLNEYKLLKLEFIGKTWSFKDESIKYCQLDCKSLHQVLVKFNNLIFNEFSINMLNCLTLPSLAMKIYRTHYMPKNSIYQLLGHIEQEIRYSYTGDPVDVYKTNNHKNGNILESLFIKLFYYDVNSLYPSVMANVNMPIGKSIYFEGDLLKYESFAFGFFKCEVEAPKILNHPIIKIRVYR